MARLTIPVGARDNTEGSPTAPVTMVEYGDDESLTSYGEQLGLDRQKLLCALRASQARRIHEDFQSGARSGVNGAPTLFINGQRYDGSQDPESLVAALRAAMSRD